MEDTKNRNRTAVLQEPWPGRFSGAGVFVVRVLPPQRKGTSGLWRGTTFRRRWPSGPRCPGRRWRRRWRRAERGSKRGARLRKGPSPNGINPACFRSCFELLQRNQAECLANILHGKFWSQRPGRNPLGSRIVAEIGSYFPRILIHSLPQFALIKVFMEYGAIQIESRLEGVQYVSGKGEL